MHMCEHSGHTWPKTTGATRAFQNQVDMIEWRETNT